MATPLFEETPVARLYGEWSAIAAQPTDLDDEGLHAWAERRWTLLLRLAAAPAQSARDVALKVLASTDDGDEWLLNTKWGEIVLAELQALATVATSEPGVVSLIAAHRAACVAHTAACKKSDAVVLGREATAEEGKRRDAACDAEIAALRQLAAYLPATLSGSAVKAAYLRLHLADGSGIESVILGELLSAVEFAVRPAIPALYSARQALVDALNTDGAIDDDQREVFDARFSLERRLLAAPAAAVRDYAFKVLVADDNDGDLNAGVQNHELVKEAYALTGVEGWTAEREANLEAWLQRLLSSK